MSISPSGTFLVSSTRQICQKPFGVPTSGWLPTKFHRGLWASKDSRRPLKGWDAWECLPLTLPVPQKMTAFQSSTGGVPSETLVVLTLSRWTGPRCSSSGRGGDVLHLCSPTTELLLRALELGINLLDTSGKAAAGQREAYNIATKFGITRDGFSSAYAGMEVKGSREYVRSAVEGSLARLNIEKIDLYYQHRVDRSVPIEETWRALKELVKEGKVKYLGISEATVDEIRRAHAVHPITACQVEWSLWTRGAEDELIPTLRELGISIVAYAPLGRGFLTGSIKSPEDFESTDMRSTAPRFQKEAFEANMRMVDRVKNLADKKGCTTGQLALAWVHAQGADVFPIPGTKRINYLEENAAAFFIELSANDTILVEDAFGKDKVVGGRYNAAGANFAYEADQQTDA